MSLLLCLMTLWSLVQPASAAEYRKISLSDGRVLQAEIIATTAQGLSVRIPQGKLDVPFTSVLNLEPLEARTYQGQPAWRVLVLPFGGPEAEAEEARASVQDALSRVPAITVGSLDSLARAGANVDALRACGQNLDCAAGPAGAAGFTAVVSGMFGPGATTNTLAVSAVFVGAPASKRTEGASLSGATADHPPEVLKVATTALQVRPEDAVLATLPARLDVAVVGSPWGSGGAPTTGTPPTTATAPPTTPSTASPWGAETPAPVATAPVKPPTSATTPKAPAPAPEVGQLRRLVWVPFPGMPSIARKDWAGFAESWAVVLPGAAALVYGTGRAAFTGPQTVGISALSVYSLTVAANSLFGLRGTTAIIAPTAGGAAISVAVPLGGKP